MKNRSRRFYRCLPACLIVAVTLVTASATVGHSNYKSNKVTPVVSFQLNEQGKTAIYVSHRFAPPPVEQVQQAFEEALGCKLQDAKLEKHDLNSRRVAEERDDGDDDPDSIVEERAAGSAAQSSTDEQHPEFLLWTFTATTTGAFPKHDLYVEGALNVKPICDLFRDSGAAKITIVLLHPPYGSSSCTPGEETVRAAGDSGYHLYNVPVDGSALQTIAISFGYRSSHLIFPIAVPLGFLFLPLALSLFLRRTVFKAEGEKRQAAWVRLWKATAWVTIAAWVGWAFMFSTPVMREMLRFVLKDRVAFDLGMRMAIYVIPPTLVSGLCYALMISVHMRLRGIAHTRRDLAQHVMAQVGTMLFVLLFSSGIGAVFYSPRLGILMFASAFVVSAIVGALKKRLLNLAPYALDTGHLRDRIFELAGRCGVKLKQVYILPEDKMRTINAMASSANHIILTNGLLANLSQREVDAVVAHELGHLKHRHPNSLTTIFIVGIVLINIATSTVSSLTRFEYGFTICVLIFLFGFNWFSRKFEYTADMHSAYLMGDPRPLISALAKMSRLMLLPMSSDPLTEKVSTHPYTRNRAEALARFGNVSAEELQDLVAGDSPDQAQYDLASIAVNKDRIFSTAAKQKISHRVAWTLIGVETIIPAIFAYIALKMGLADSSRLMLYFGAFFATTTIYFWLNNRLPVMGCKAMAEKLREKLEGEGAGPMKQPGTFVGFSPHSEIRYYETNDDWDLGYLFIDGNRLCYVGEQTRFALLAEQIREINVVASSTSWFRSERLFMTWSDSERNTISTFNLHPIEADSLTDGTMKTRALAEKLREWARTADVDQDVRPLVDGLTQPNIGNVTSRALSEVIAPGKFINLAIVVLFVSTVLCLALRLPFSPQRGGGALYAIAVALILTVLQAIPLLKSQKRQKVRTAGHQEAVAPLEVAE